MPGEDTNVPDHLRRLCNRILSSKHENVPKENSGFLPTPGAALLPSMVLSFRLLLLWKVVVRWLGREEKEQLTREIVDKMVRLHDFRIRRQRVALTL